jgi:hypothetical protein
MKGSIHDRRRAGAGALLLALLTSALAPLPAVAIPSLALAACTTSTPDGAAMSGFDWRAQLDADGQVVGYVLESASVDGRTTLVETGSSASAVQRGQAHILLVERDVARTRFTDIDAAQGCRAWQSDLDLLAYDPWVDPATSAIRFVVVDPVDRSFEGVYELTIGTGADPRLVSTVCPSECQPGDGTTDAPILLAAPAGGGTPTPVFSGGGWAVDTALPFRWLAKSPPPTWARPAIKDAALDATDSRRSRAPTFRYDADADDDIQYTDAFPSFCANGIACALRSLPYWWKVYLRPQGTDFQWGRLRWCQRTDGDGCFDIERVILHELGHITGLAHPEEAGLTLSAADSVMQHITPAKPKAGWTKHAFGRCDAAALQLVYGLLTRSSLVSTCLGLETRLTLEAGSTSVTKGGDVTLTARLSIADRSGYRALRGDPLKGRSVKLRFRAAGSSDPWTTTWMADGSTAGTYVTVLRPNRSLDLQAVFSSPVDEGLLGDKSAIVTVRVVP